MLKEIGNFYRSWGEAQEFCHFTDKSKWRKYCQTRAILPVILSHRMRDVMIRPYGLNSDSRSGWDIFFGKPDTYKLAPLIASELGLANDTCNFKN